MVKNFGRFTSKAEGYDHVAQWHGIELGIKPQYVLPYLVLAPNDDSDDIIYQFSIESDSINAPTIFRLKYQNTLNGCAGCIRSYNPYPIIEPDLIYCSRTRKEATELCCFYEDLRYQAGILGNSITEMKAFFS